MRLIILKPSLFFQISVFVHFFPNLHNNVVMLSTFYPLLCVVGCSNYFIMLLSCLKLHKEVSGFIILNSVKLKNCFWLINLYLGQQKCRHWIRFPSQKERLSIVLIKSVMVSKSAECMLHSIKTLNVRGHNTFWQRPQRGR